MSQKPDPKSGRVAFDDRGQPVWERRVETGVFSREIDTTQVRRIQENASVKLEDEAASRAAGFDPYSTEPPAANPKQPRRTLDDMRKLSEEIKKNRGRK